MNELPPQTQLRDGRYQVLERIGKGAFGLVYRAHDTLADQVVALKQLNESNPEQVKSFGHEAQLLARLTHPNLPKVTDQFTERATWFLVMDFIPGETLLARLGQHNGPLPPTDVLAWADQILAALEYLHSREPSVIHRDIKPENLKLTPDGRVMLLDFGIAKGLLTPDGKPIPSQRFGTAEYAPPEQLRCIGTDPRSDLYALATTLYQLLTKKLPIDALERFAKLHMRQADPLVSLQQVVPTLPRTLDTVLLKALNLIPEQRYANASEMRQALKAVASQLVPAPPPPPAPPTPLRWYHRLPFLTRTLTPPPVWPAWVPEMVEVPAGPFLMGSTDQQIADLISQGAFGDWVEMEKPQHTLSLPDYWIGKTPVTNAQFGPFVAGDGYTNQAYWTAAGWQWREAEKVVKPGDWDYRQWYAALSYGAAGARPVVGVSWFEALAYCRWLSVQTGIEFRLPSEAEWEKAARGRDGRIYPWGNTWEAGRCNSEEAGIKYPTPVGKYPSGASPYGALDMAGNVWEWCATKWGKPYPYQLEDEWQPAYVEADQNRVVRGGSSWSSSAYVRGAYRGYYYPRDRLDDLGLRVASHSLRLDSGF